MGKFEVTYTIKKDDGLITDHRAVFTSLQDAIKFIRTLGTYVRLVGKPSLERA